MPSVLVLSEDSSKDAHDTLVAVIKKMFQLIEPSCQTHRIAFEPTPEAHISVVRANAWKSTSRASHQEQVALRRTIATKLGENDGFVLFHVDGDRTWADRHQSENRAKFQKLVIDPVRLLLMQLEPSGKLSADDVDRRITRLCPLMPFYSIEAWLYQNIARAMRICRDQYGGRDLARFEEWQADRGLLDEVPQPKDGVCLAAKHNRELATQAFPHEVVHEVGKSFTHAVNTLRACHGLQAALETTWHPAGS